MNKKWPLPSSDSLEECFEVCDLLRPSIEAMAQHIASVEGDGFLTLGNVRTAIAWLNAEMEKQSKSVQSAWETAKAAHWSKHVSPENEMLADIAFLMCPGRFHEQGLGPQRYKDVVAHLKELVRAKVRAAQPTQGDGEAQTQNEGEGMRKAAKRGGLAGLFGDDPVTDGDADQQVDDYLQLCKRLKKDVEDSLRLRWWVTHREEFRLLFEVVMEIGCITSSAAACERQFSRGKRRLTKQRLDMNSDTLESRVASGENTDLQLDEWRLSSFKELLPQHRPRVMDEGDEWLAVE
jgi:hypothetical protein